jgi:peptide/nickel transport system substrate-binding protein
MGVHRAQEAVDMDKKWLSLALLLAVALAPAAVRAEKVLRVVPHADLKILDPYATTATITLMHGQMVYDQLFSWNEKLEPKPQMVEHYEISPDKLAYTFTLRPGLKFHDGQPVTTRDVIASLKRWMTRDVLGQAMNPFVEEMKAENDKTFVLRLKQPFAFVETAFAISAGTAPVIMREQDALTDPFKSITTAIGSGPFKFVDAEWNPGAKTVYVKNPDYVPRSDPPDGNAGAKLAKVDRVEWVVLPDPFTKSSAIQRGEVDIIDQLPNDQIPVLEKNKEIRLDRTSHLASIGYIRPNHLYPPFDNPKVRQALALAVSQEEYLSAAFGDERWWRQCFSFFVCGSPNETEAGSEPYQKQDLARAKQLLQEAGYKGEKVVLINTHEIASIGALGDVTANNLKKLGFNVEIADSDWGTLVARRAKKDAPDKGGWNLFHTTSGGASVHSPITNFTIDSGCGRTNWFGWPCDEEAEKLRTAYLTAPDETARRAILVQLHRRLWESLPTIPIGQYVTPYAARANVRGILHSSPIVFWNVDKE